MGDLSIIVNEPKKTNLPSISCPMLTSANYTLWSIRMKILLKVHEVWELVEEESTDSKKNNLAIALLFQSIPESVTMQIGGLDTAKKVWEAIKSRHLGAERVREARLQTLSEEFDRLKMKDTETIDDFVGKISELSSRSAALGETIEETKMVKKFLKSLPKKKFIHMVASLEQLLNLKETSFEDVVGRMKAYEERIKEDEEDIQSDQTKLMYANSDANSQSYGDSRGRDVEDAMVEAVAEEGMEEKWIFQGLLVSGVTNLDTLLLVVLIVC